MSVHEGPHIVILEGKPRKKEKATLGECGRIPEPVQLYHKTTTERKFAMFEMCKCDRTSKCSTGNLLQLSK